VRGNHRAPLARNVFSSLLYSHRPHWLPVLSIPIPGGAGRAHRRAAVRLEDLRNPPGNRLEALVGERAGQYSIRVNDQWRLCFVRREGEAYDVEIVDYH
jgi:hypothetical protein